MSNPTPPTTAPFHIMAKPIGALCNLDCTYCFYLEKEKLYPQHQDHRSFRMTDEVLESYIRQYIAQQNTPEITFAWQGGEPTLLGLDFFKRAVELQTRHCPPDKRIANALQTNGILLDDDWCKFFHDHHFLIGLSIDGPREIHDRYRVNKGGKPTFDLVLRAMNLMKTHHVEFNTLTVVTREGGKHPLDIYHFLKEQGSTFMQFIPLVERAGQPQADDLAPPPLLKILTPFAAVMPWSVEPLDYGTFLSTIFDEWVRHDVGRWYVQIFDVQLAVEMGHPAPLCVFAETCGRGLALEHNGDLFACDHYVYDHYKLGNILDRTLAEMVDSPQQTTFGTDKRDALPQYCRKCPVLAHCHGECPKHRFNLTPDGEPGLNYLCSGYKHFFTHIKPYLRTMADLLAQRRAPAEIIQILAVQEGRAPAPAARPKTSPLIRPASRLPGRNDPCPCGSGRKFKQCCGARG